MRPKAPTIELQAVFFFVFGRGWGCGGVVASSSFNLVTTAVYNLLYAVVLLWRFGHGRGGRGEVG